MNISGQLINFFPYDLPLRYEKEGVTENVYGRVKAKFFTMRVTHPYKKKVRRKSKKPRWTVRSSCKRCSVKKVFLEISRSSQENTCASVSFQTFQACNFIKKETPSQLFFCEFWEISKNTFFYKTPTAVAAASKL